ncbi:organomercurial lyase [Kitasatospora sp. MMS16-BH015]|uniref:organomercurial lyase n=1 Tax=Kitasatospora sp. MMS16-BH015 TaxID=2018025 RepID=UPI000CF1FEA0
MGCRASLCPSALVPPPAYPLGDPRRHPRSLPRPGTLTVTPDGVRGPAPATAAVTIAPATGADIREVFCNRVNFYATTQLAEAAAEQATDLAACTVDEAWDIGKRLADLF